MWFIGAEVEQATSAPLPTKNPGSAPDLGGVLLTANGKEACCGQAVVLTCSKAKLTQL